MTLYVGKVRYDAKGKRWLLAVEPDVMLRAKRIFPKISESAQGMVALSDTAENARDLRWFLDRYPLEIPRGDQARLDARADEHVEQESVVARILSAGYVPPPCELAVPARDYQLVVPPLVLANKALLVADDAGVGKTVSAIATIVHPDMRPAVVVTLKALPAQWQRMFARFAPSLRTHILREGPVYDFTAPNKRHGNPGNPDVVILNYHKLVKWSGHLAKWLRGRGLLAYDEIQELRHAKHGNLPVARYEAALFLRDHAAHRLGLSATPAFGLGGQIYNVLEVLKEGQVGSREEFKREHCKGPDEKLEVKDPDALGAMLDRRGIRLRRTRAETGRELPPIQRLTQPVEADLHALAQIKSSAVELARLMLSHNGDVLRRGQAARDLDWKLRHATGLAKAPHVADFVRMLLESGEKVLLYGYHKDCYAVWRERLKDWNPVFFTGSESDAQKRESFARFTDPNHKDPSRLFVCSIRAGTGLDGLQDSGCHVGVNGELDWEPPILEQNECRIYRDGQPDPVVFYYCVADVGSDPIMLDTLGLKDGILTALSNPYAAKTEAKIDEAAVRERMSRLAADYLKKHDPKGLAQIERDNARLAEEKLAAKEAKRRGALAVPDVERHAMSEPSVVAPAENAITAPLPVDVAPEPDANPSAAPNGSPVAPLPVVEANPPAAPESSPPPPPPPSPPLDPWAARAAALGRARGELRKGPPGSRAHKGRPC